MIDPNLPVVAVFGSNTPTDAAKIAARLLGAAANRLGGVLLTGAVPPKDGYAGLPDQVKDAAIHGANKGASAERPPTWIGVANTPGAAAPEWRSPRSVVLTPGWGHRRNFVEACLCDAAIAIVEPDAHWPISKGTASEAFFCMFLGRPVLLVGADLADVALAPRALRGPAEERVKPREPERLAVDRGIADAYQWARTAVATPDVRPFPEDDSSAEGLVSEVLGKVTVRAPRVDLSDLRDEPSWDRYVRVCAIA